MQNKNLKLKLGLCGLALTSFLAINSHAVVHADTVSNNDAGSITWDSDKDDSQIVKEKPQYAQKQESVQARQLQSIQNKKVMVSKVSSTPSVQRPTINNVKVSSVQDVAQASVQKQKVAQFNQGSKIYTLNGSSQLSKNNGDGYVITNAGTYNGRNVDIGVTINGVQDNQGTYTTKWSNGDKADVTGKTDANFKYQDSVLLNQQQITPQPDQSKTRPRTETQNVPQKLNGFWVRFDEQYNASGNDQNVKEPTIIDPELVASAMTVLKYDEQHAVYALVHDNIISFSGNLGSYDSFAKKMLTGTNASDAVSIISNISKNYAVPDKLFLGPSDGYYNGYPIDDPSRSWYVHYSLANSAPQLTFHNFGPNIMQNDEGYANIATGTVSKNAKGKLVVGNDCGSWRIYANSDDPGNGNFFDPSSFGETTDQLNKLLSHISSNGYNFTISEPVQVTDHLQVDSSTPASLNYNYTVGLYDAQTGDLITDLKAEYNSKAGVQATAKDSVMNNAIKSKIQQINQNKAQVSYTGTRANDDVAFYKETRAVNPQDQSLHKSATRIISVNLPDDAAAKARYKGILNANNQVVQTINFTRTGVENVANGQVTYGAWQGPSSFGAVTLPDIPGYTMTMTMN